MNSLKKIGIFLVAATLGFFVMTEGRAVAATQREAKERAARLPEKLPSKGASRTSADRTANSPKRTYIDFSSGDKSAKPGSRLDKALKKSDQDLAASQPPVEVRSRKILAAPLGDSAEPLSAMSAKATPTPAPVAVEKVLVKENFETKPAEIASPAPKATPEPLIALEPTPQPVPETKPEPATSMPAPMRVDPINSSPVEIEAPESEIVIEHVPVQPAPLVTTVRTTTEKVSANNAPESESLLFIRPGFLNAGFSKFDSRMQNGATSTGLGIAKNFASPWGLVEGRAAFDVYHATDQSVSLENVRMLAARAEVAHWFSQGRFRPGLAMGLGLTDYSIRSYRAIDGSGDVTVRTHAKSRALAFIPAATVRADLFEKSVVEAQAEYLGLMGGESVDAARGFALTLSLGLKF